MIIVQFLNPSISTVLCTICNIKFTINEVLYISFTQKGGLVMNEWLAHLCNPQLKSQQLQDLKGPCYHQPKGFKERIDVREGRDHVMFLILMMCYILSMSYAPIS